MQRTVEPRAGARPCGCQESALALCAAAVVCVIAGVSLVPSIAVALAAALAGKCAGIWRGRLA